MVLLLVFMQLTRDLFAIAKFLLKLCTENGFLGHGVYRRVNVKVSYLHCISVERRRHKSIGQIASNTENCEIWIIQ